MNLLRRSVVVMLACVAGTSLFAQQPLPDPLVWSAADIRQKPLVIAPGTVTIGTQSMTTNLYNGMYTPPVFRVSPGDSIDLTVVNHMLPENAAAVPKTAAAKRTSVQAVPSLFEGLGMEVRSKTENIRKSMAMEMHVPVFYSNVHYHGLGVSPIGANIALYRAE